LAVLACPGAATDEASGGLLEQKLPIYVAQH
jgi:hypothetical protein